MTLQLELPEELERNLILAAQRDHVTGEDLVLRVLSDYLQQDKHRQAVKEAGDYVQRKNAELYRRLA